MFRVFPHSFSVPALACALGLTLSACMDEAGPGARPDPVDRDLPRLFSASPAGLEPAKAYPEELRSRLNAVEPSLLADGGAALAGAARFELNLFEDAAFTAEVDRSEASGPGRFTLNGHLAGAEGSYFILTYADGMVAVTAYDPKRGYYEMEPAGDGVVKVSEFAPGKLPRVTHGMLWPDGMPMDHGSMDMPPEAMPKAAAGPSVVDIMVVYTAAASAGAGGEAAIRARIDKAVAEANTAFLNSQVNAKLNLVHAEQVAYAESGNLGTDLGRLQGKTDGYMDNVHALRETYKADLVSLVVENTSAGVAGIGYVMTSVSSYFKTYAFTAIARQYTGAYNTLAHEVGHNLGCAHDRQNSTSQAAYPYSYGYRFYANGIQYRTIMAYSPGQGIPYYSNPNVSYLGVPTGIPDGLANSADNARTLNNTSPTAMNFYAGAVITPAQKNALLVVGSSSSPTAADQAVINRLQSLGFAVTAKTGPAVAAADANGMSLVVVSSTVSSPDVGTKFRAATVPVVSWEQALQDDFGMVDLNSASVGLATGQTQLQMTGSTHPIAGGLTGLQTVAATAGDFNWGKPNANAVAIATQAGDATHSPVYAYEKGATMPGLVAPARRVQLFLTDATGASLTAAGWTLFDNAVKWAAGL